MNLRKWNIYFRWENAIVILLSWCMAIFNIFKGKVAYALWLVFYQCLF